MKAVTWRIRRLEDQFKPARNSRQHFRLVVSRLDRKLSLDTSTCVRILDKCGSQSGTVRLDRSPEGLCAAELEKFLRRSAVETRITR